MLDDVLGEHGRCMKALKSMTVDIAHERVAPVLAFTPSEVFPWGLNAVWKGAWASAELPHALCNGLF